MAVVSGEYSAFEHSERRSYSGVPGHYGSVLFGVRHHSGCAPREGGFGVGELVSHAYCHRASADDTSCRSGESDEGTANKLADSDCATGDTVTNANADEGAADAYSAGFTDCNASVDAECDRDIGAADSHAYLGGHDHADSDASRDDHAGASPDADARSGRYDYPRGGHADSIGNQGWPVSGSAGDDAIMFRRKGGQKET